MPKIDVTPTHTACLSLEGDNAYGVRSNQEFPKQHSFFNLISTIFHELTYNIKAGYKNLIPYKYAHHLDLDPRHGEDGLIVFFYGLNGNPSLWNNHLDQFKKLEDKDEDTSLAFYTPLLPNKGQCTLNDLGIDEIVGKIENWIALHPNKPLVLVGQSNGSRIALEIETRLRKSAHSTPIYLSLTSPVLYGTSLINKLSEKIGIHCLSKMTCGLLTPLSLEELKMGSDSSKELLSKARSPLPERCAERRYRMYASSLDTHVWETGSALPILNPDRDLLKNEKHYLVPSYGHDSIVNAFTQEQVQKSFHWIKRKNNPHFSRLSCVHCLSKSLDGGGTLALPIDKRSLLIKIAHRIKMIFQAIGMLCIRAYDNLQSLWHRETHPTPQKDTLNQTFFYPQEQLPWNTSRPNTSQGLNLYIHGLNGSPLDWIRLSHQMKEEHPEMDTICPHVVLKGNCSIETAADPLLQLIEDYLKKHPGNPVTIIGTSNGGRIATYIESRLDPSLLSGSTLTVASIAGVHYGTKVIDKLKNAKLLRFAQLDSKLAKDFEWGSAAAQRLHHNWRNKQLVWQQEGCSVRHLFCASTEDELVQSIAASLPLAPSQVLEEDKLVYTHKIYHGQSHTSIVEHARTDLMNWIFNDRCSKK